MTEGEHQRKVKAVIQVCLEKVVVAAHSMVPHCLAFQLS